MKDYTITCTRFENPLTESQFNTEWEFPLTMHFKAETEACALDQFQHKVFYEAKKNGYRIHHYNKEEMAFIANISIYGIDETYVKYVVFKNIEIKENENAQD